MTLNDTFIRVTKTVQDFGQLLPAQDVLDESNLASLVKKDPKSDWYTSIFQYGNDVVDYFNKNEGSIKGYNGPAFTNKLIFDFDSKADVDLARKDAIEVISRLMDNYGVALDNIRVFWSGNKGVHLEVPTAGKFTPSELKNICFGIAGDLKTFDTKIYNITRIFRVNNTYNPNGKLWKVELEPEELSTLSIEAIKKKAEQPSISSFKPVVFKNVFVFDKLKNDNTKLKPVITAYTGKDIAGIRGLDTINYDACPKPMPRCLYALSHGVMQSGGGERNALFLRLAAYYRGQGMPKEVALMTLQGVAAENAKLYPEHDMYTREELENTVINSVYSSREFKQIPGATGLDPNNEMVKRYCDAVGQFTDKKCCVHHKVGKETTVQISKVSDDFEDFARNFDKNTVKTGINFIDKYMNIAIGTTTLIVGSTGCGKTSLALNILENSGQLGQHAVFFSMDTHKNLIYLKLAQKVTNYSQKQILEFYKTKDQTRIVEIRNAISERYGKVFFDFSSTLSGDQMKNIVFKLEQENNCKIKLVIVDYAGRVAGPYSDTFANANFNALQSTGIAAETEAAWIYLSQISRNMGDGATPLRTKRAAKESGTWEESASNVITIWRPFLADPTRDDVLRLFLAKNRMGRELEEILHFDGAKGMISSMTDQELADYNANREKEEKDFLKSRQNKSI